MFCVGITKTAEPTLMMIVMNLFSSQVLLESSSKGTTSSGYCGTHLGEANFVTEIHHWT